MKRFKRYILLLFVVIFATGASQNTVFAAQISKNGTASNIENNYLTKKQETGLKKNLPSKYSMVDEKLVTDVKSQNTNICWAFASTSGFESMLLKNGLYKNPLDIFHMDKWATPDKNNVGWQREQGDGAYTYIPCGYYTSWSGAVEQNKNDVKQGVCSLVYLGKDDRELIKSTVYNSGFVVVNFNSLDKYWSKDDTSYCLNKEISSVSGHSVQVVGWDDDYSKENFTGDCTPSKNGAWLCKNSWGKFNNLNGYFWLSYEDYYAFNNDIFAPSYGVTSFVNITDSHHLYQNEIYGATYEFDYWKEDDVVTFMNVFDFSQDGNDLDKIIFETTAVNAKYKLYYIPVDTNYEPIVNKKHWIELGQGKVSTAGYICEDVDMIVPKQKGAIGVTIDTTGLDIASSIGVDEWLTDEKDNLIFYDDCEDFNSYLLYGDTLEEFSNFYIHRFEDSIGGNPVIKAVTSDNYDLLYGDVNNDTNVNIKDVTEIQKYLAGMIGFDKYQKASADFSKDCVLNIIDATRIQKYIAKVNS